ncbi:MAG TPA: AarF/ABC1/UbiB kinase family protein [Thermoleophilaceae bacterium]|nr:AarF/ABC1/UbiB kinase family protein [Thermoleophilaceae bacterium]
MARKDESSVPTGRIRRTAKVAGLAGGQTARNYATKAANLTRGEQARREAAARRQAEAAEQILDVLGNMKGAAMKVGQVASFIDTGAFPAEFQARIQEKLAELRDSAPRVPFKQMRAVIEDGLGARIGDVFAEFDEQAVAAASIGQVYRARLHEGTGGKLAGREVAVKVQYPGVAQAVRADLQNLGLLMRVAKRIAPGMDVKAMTAEIRERLSDELDYEQEAQAQRAMARSWRGHPFVVIPAVATSLSSERVLVTEWLKGQSFEQVRELPEAERDRFGEIVYRFFCGSLYRNGHFSGDPHPGNYRLMDDGRVAFLDFGMTKHVDREYLDRELAVLRAGMAGDANALHAALVTAGYYAADDPLVSPEAVLAHVRAIAWWYMEDRPVTIDRELVTQVLIDAGDPRSTHWELIKRGTVPAEAILARRMEGLVVGVLGHLGVTANWHRIACEWLFGDPPSTPLGELEAEYFGERSAAA